MKIDNIFLQKSTAGEGFYLQKTNENILMCRQILNGSISHKLTVVFDSPIQSFDAIIDSEDTVHIVLSDTKGNILHINNKENKWIKSYILNATPDVDIVFKNLYVFQHKATFSILYTARKGERNILCHQLIEENPQKPTVVSELSEHNDEIFLTSDNDGNIAAFFCEKALKTLGCKVFNVDNKQWSEFYSINIKVEKLSNLFVLNEKNIYFITYKTGDGLFLIQVEQTDIFLNNTLRNQKNGHEKLLSKRHTTDCLCPILRFKDGSLELFWSNGLMIFSSNANNRAENWQRIKEERVKTTDLIKICKLYNAESGITGYDIFYISNGKIKLYKNEGFLEYKAEKAEKLPISENNIKTRETIEREKEEIMKRLGITKSNDSFELDGEDEWLTKEFHRFSTADKNNIPKQTLTSNFKIDEIITELKKINKELSVLSHIIGKDSPKNQRKNKSKHNTKIILAKLHKK